MSIRNVFDVLDTQAKPAPVAGISIAKLLVDEGFNYYGSRLSPGTKISPHYHRAGREVYIVLDGRGLIHTWLPGETTKQSHRVERGAIFDIPPGTIHQLENDSGAPLALVFACQPSHLAEDRIPA
jgi:mannose-6-phosphate isomerase-like protein (cupin superfamily)